MIVRKKMNHQCSDETLQEESHDLGYDEPIHSGNSQLNKRRATFRSSFAKWSFLSTARSCDIVAGTTELIPLTASSLKRKKKLFNNASKSRQIAVQGMLYVCAFYITWLFPTIQRIMELSGSDQYFVVQLFDTILLPLQGLLNFTIYIRPKFMALRKNSPDSGFWGALWKASYEIWKKLIVLIHSEELEFQSGNDQLFKCVQHVLRGRVVWSCWWSTMWLTRDRIRNNVVVKNTVWEYHYIDFYILYRKCVQIWCYFF